jgi:hypothetical protein
LPSDKAASEIVRVHGADLTVNSDPLEVLFTLDLPLI